MDGAGDADTSGRGERLQARRHVDAVALDVIPIDHHVAEVDAHPKRDAAVLGNVGLVLGHSLLHLDGVAHGVDHTGELSEHPVSHELDDAPMVIRDLGIDDVLADRLEGRKSAFLVGSDHPRIANHVSGEDRREFPRDRLGCHVASPQSAMSANHSFKQVTRQSPNRIRDRPHPVTGTGKCTPGTVDLDR